MENWFFELTTIEKVYWVLAAFSTVLFISIMITTFVGGDTETNFDVDTEIESDTGIEFQFMTFKNTVAFFCIFSWSGIACLEANFSIALTILISVICGLIMMVVMASLHYYMSKLQENNTFQYKNAIGKTAEVYSTIGKNKSSMGKVLINVQGSMRELEALTIDDQDLILGNIVKVKEVTENGVLIVTIV